MTATTIRSPRGYLCGASARGAAHIARNKPNQDSVAVDQRGEWAFLAVADGHGGGPHYRSDRGSRFATAAMIAVLRELTQDGSAKDAGPLRAALPGLAHRLVGRWRQLVEADMAMDAIEETGVFERLGVYGSTCVGAAIGPGFLVAAQIGDGDLYVATNSGDAARIFPDDDLVGEQTYSLCQPEAVEQVKLALHAAPNPLAAPDFLFAATDGFSKSFKDEEAVRIVLRQYRQGMKDRGVAAIALELPDWLAKCSELGSGDDISVAIFSRADVEQAAAPPPPEKRSGMVWAAAFLAVFLIGFVAGLFARSAIDRQLERPETIDDARIKAPIVPSPAPKTEAPPKSDAPSSELRPPKAVPVEGKPAAPARPEPKPPKPPQAPTKDEAGAPKE